MRRLIEWGLLAATVLLRVVGLVLSMSTLIAVLVQPDAGIDDGRSQRPDWSQAADAWYTSAFIETDEER